MSLRRLTVDRSAKREKDNSLTKSGSMERFTVDDSADRGPYRKKLDRVRARD